MSALRFGVIGLSEGNGHPYSWSAIFNGYDADAMETCPFPVIPQYLARQRFPDDAIAGAAVTHVWTQDPRSSQHIARASRIPHVVGDPRDMLGHIDGLLLARDDAENHLGLAAPFLEAGLPVYVDKPLALDEASARKLLALQRWPGQVFTCSALRYGREFQLSAEERERLGRLRFIQGIVPKDWDRYAIHVLDPALCLMGGAPQVVESRSWHLGGVTTLCVSWANGVQGNFSAMGRNGGAAPVALRVVGDGGSQDMIFEDAFSAFKGALEAFVTTARDRRPVHDIELDLAAVRLIEAGREAGQR